MSAVAPDRARNPAPDPARALARIAAVRQRTETVFDSTGAELFDARDRIAGLQADFTAMAALFAPEGLRRMNATAGRLSDLASEAESAGSAFRALAGRLTAAVQDARGALHDLRRRTHTAAIVALNARVVGRSMQVRDSAVDSFAEDMRALSLEAAEAVTDLGARMDEIIATIAELRSGTLAVEAALARNVLPRLRDFGQLLAAIEAEGPALAGAAQAMLRQVGALGGLIPRLVTQMQAGDAVTQRLDHAEQILGRAAQGTSAEAGALAALAGLQVAGARGAMDQALDRLAPGFEELGGLADSLARTARGRLGGEGDSGSRIARLAAQAEALRQGFAESRDLQGATREQAGQLELILELVGLQARKVHEFDKRMMLVGLNAIVVASRLGREGRAMTEVSQQLREVSGQISESHRRLLDAIERIVAETRQLGDAEGPGAALTGAAAGEALVALEELAAEMEHRVSAAGAGIDGAEAGIFAPIRAARSRLAGYRAETESLARAVGELPEAGRTTPTAAAATLSELRGLYTMDEERALHDGYAGTPPASPGETGDPGGGDSGEGLDAILF